MKEPALPAPAFAGRGRFHASLWQVKDFCVSCPISHVRPLVEDPVSFPEPCEFRGGKRDQARPDLPRVRTIRKRIDLEERSFQCSTCASGRGGLRRSRRSGYIATVMPAHADTYGWGHASAVGGDGVSETCITQERTVSDSFSGGIGGRPTVDGTTTATADAVIDSAPRRTTPRATTGPHRGSATRTRRPLRTSRTPSRRPRPVPRPSALLGGPLLDVREGVSRA